MFTLTKPNQTLDFGQNVGSSHTGPQSCFRKSSGDKLAGPSFAGDRSRQQDRCVSFLKLDPPPIQCAARVNSLLTEQSSYNFNSVISFSTFTRRTAYSWQRVQFETTTLAHLLASCVRPETLEPGKASTVYIDCGCLLWRQQYYEDNKYSILLLSLPPIKIISEPSYSYQPMRIFREYVKVI